MFFPTGDLIHGANGKEAGLTQKWRFYSFALILGCLVFLLTLSTNQFKLFLSLPSSCSIFLALQNLEEMNYVANYRDGVSINLQSCKVVANIAVVVNCTDVCMVHR